MAQSLIAEFCELCNFAYQQQQGLFAVGFYNSVLPVAPARGSAPRGEAAADEPLDEVEEAPADEGPVEEVRNDASPQGHHGSEEHLAGQDQTADVEFGDEPGGEEAA